MPRFANRPLRMIAAALGLLITSHPVASAAPPNPEQAAQLQKQADAEVNQAEGFDARASKAEGELADDAKNAAAACRQVAERVRALAAAVEAGNDENIKVANTELNAARVQQRVANEKVNTRQAIVGFGLSGPNLDQLTKRTPEANRPLLDALLAAKQKAIDSGNTFYATLAPEAKPIDIEVARDLFIQGQNELELANMTLALANERASMAASKGADEPLAALKLAEIAKNEEEWLATRKAVQEANLKLRELERSRNAARQEFEVLRLPKP